MQDTDKPCFPSKTEMFVGRMGGTLSLPNVSVCFPPQSLDESAKVRVTLEDPIENYRPIVRIGLENDVVFAPPVIKLESHN